ncbi:hypothetical protein SROCM77S_06811 [Streptomyces rochei]
MASRSRNREAGTARITDLPRPRRSGRGELPRLGRGGRTRHRRGRPAAPGPRQPPPRTTPDRTRRPARRLPADPASDGTPRPLRALRTQHGSPRRLHATRALADSGPPLFLAVGACPPPHTTTVLADAADLPDEDLLPLLDEIGSLPPGASASPGGLWRRTFLPVLRDDLRLARSLRNAALDPSPAGPPDVPVLVFAGRDDPLAAPAALRHWQQWTTNLIELHTVAGGHFFASSSSLAQHVGRACRGHVTALPTGGRPVNRVVITGIGVVPPARWGTAGSGPADLSAAPPPAASPSSTPAATAPASPPRSTSPPPPTDRTSPTPNAWTARHSSRWSPHAKPSPTAASRTASAATPCAPASAWAAPSAAPRAWPPSTPSSATAAPPGPSTTPRPPNPSTTTSSPSSLAATVARDRGAQGPVALVSSGCTSGLDAVGHGADLIREGSADIVVAGGTEAPIVPIAMACFDRLRLTSSRNDDPATASRPFDRTRDGFVLGEGAAVLVLEELEHARRRGARPYAELSAVTAHSSAHHIYGTAPRGTGDGRRHPRRPRPGTAEPRRRRLHQRPRRGNPAQRPARDTRPQGKPGRQRPPRARQLHQVDDRARPGRRRRP